MRGVARGVSATRAASPTSSAGTKLGRKSKLDDHQQQEAIARLKAGESLWTIAKSYRVRHATIGRLSAELEEVRRVGFGPAPGPDRGGTGPRATARMGTEIIPARHGPR